MKKQIALMFFLVLSAACVAVPAVAGVGSWIEINKGQAAAEFKALARDGDNLLLLQPHRARIVMPMAKSNSATPADQMPQTGMQGLSVDLLISGANKNAGIEPGEKRPGISRYFSGPPSEWLKQVNHLESVRFVEVYPGIDLVYRLRGSRIEYDFEARLGADLSLIRLELQGAQTLRIADNGDWVATTEAGELRQKAPEIFTLDEAGRQPVSGHFIETDNGMGFRVAASTADLPIIIDPVIEFSGYLGGSNKDEGRDIAMRPNGNLVLSGITQSADIPGTPPGTVVNAIDIFIAEVDRASGQLLWVDYIGGAGEDISDAMKLDSQGNIVAAGYTTSANFPVINAFQNNFVGNDSGHPDFNWDSLLFKLSSDGSTMVFSTYYGGADVSIDGPAGKIGFEWFRGLAIDGNDNIYAVGQTSAFDFPVTENFGGRSCLQTELDALMIFVSDIALVRFAPDGTREFATCIGGTERDAGRDVAFGPDGNLYIGGFARSANLPTSANAFQTTPIDLAYSAFVLKLNAGMDGIEWGSYVGGNGNEILQEIAIDNDGFVYGTGSTDSTDLPLTPNAIQTLLNNSFLPDLFSGITDAFVFKMLPDGTDLAYSTYFGGAIEDYSFTTRIDQQGRVYFAGETQSRNLLLRTPLQDTPGPYLGTPTAIEGTGDIKALSPGQAILNNDFVTGLFLGRDGVNQFHYEFNDTQGLIDVGPAADNTLDVIETFNAGAIFINAFAQNTIFESDFPDGSFILTHTFGSETADSRAAARLFLGGLDVVVANFGQANEIFIESTGNTVEFGRPDGRTVDVVTLNFGNDIVFANEGQDIRLYEYNFNNGTYGPPVILDANPNGVTSLATGDFDSDSNQELIIGRNGGPIQIVSFLAGNPSPAVELPGSGDITLSLLAYDIDNDGDDDLLVGNDGKDQFYINDGFGNLSLDSRYVSGDDRTVALVTDLDFGQLYRSNDGVLEQYPSSGNSDVFLAVIDTNTGTLEFSTYLDGLGNDTMFRGMTLGDGGSVLLTGTSNGPGWPVNGGSQAVPNGDDDAVFMIIDLDIDDDGVLDGSDNCLEAANPDQRDTDADGFGNFCDADFNNDNIVNFADLNVLRDRFFLSDPDADLNGDGNVNFADLAIASELFFLPPGPSGLFLP